jgi:hypothetical protein
LENRLRLEGTENPVIICPNIVNEILASFFFERVKFCFL